MVKRIVNLPSMNGWAGTAAAAFTAHTVTVDIPTGPRYHAIHISGNAGAGKKFTDLFGEMRCKVNGKVQRTFTGLELLKLNALMGSSFCGNSGNVAATAFTVPIWFAEPWRKSVASQDGLAWGTGDLSSFQLECDITAYGAAAAGLTERGLRALVPGSAVLLQAARVAAAIGVGIGVLTLASMLLRVREFELSRDLVLKRLGRGRQ
jgi:hypothetical protein